MKTFAEMDEMINRRKFLGGAAGLATGLVAPKLFSAEEKSLSDRDIFQLWLTEGKTKLGNDSSRWISQTLPTISTEALLRYQKQVAGNEAGTRTNLLLIDMEIIFRSDQEGLELVAKSNHPFNQLATKMIIGGNSGAWQKLRQKRGEKDELTITGVKVPGIMAKIIPIDSNLVKGLLK